MSLTLQQLETGKGYVFHRTGFANDFAATFIALGINESTGLITSLLVRNIETGQEEDIDVYTQCIEIVPLTREWLEARMDAHAATVITLHARCSNLLNARKEL
jgi:hypothetical protein